MATKENSINDKGADAQHSATTSTIQTFRTADEVIDWDQYFMSIAYLSALRSKDSKCQVGACIVNQQNRIVGVGYNGMPDQFAAKSGSISEMKETESSNDTNDVWDLAMKKYYVCHAELNAVMNSFGRPLQGCRIYVTRTPCSECSKLIVQSGISEVIYHSSKPFNSFHADVDEAGEAALKTLHRAGIRTRGCRLDLDKIFRSFQTTYDANDKHGETE